MDNDRRKILEGFEKNREYTEARVKYGIEAYRKGEAEIQITDEEGKPLKGVTVKVHQKNHAFRYGANLFMLDEMETAEKNEKYKEVFKKTFNMATLPFYWQDLEPEEGKPRYAKNSVRVYRRPAPDLCMEYCLENGIEPREHGLAYDHYFPDWLRNADVETIKRKYEKRCREISERYGKDIRTIEVVNEPFWNIWNSALYNEPDFVEYCFKTARKYFGANQLGINDGGEMWDDNGRTNDRYYMVIEQVLRNGAEIDAVGLQYHMFYKPEEEYEKTRKRYDPKHLYKIMDLYGRFNKALQITEITIPAYSEKKEDEELPAEIIRNIYSIWFSYEKVEQIMYWNLVDGYAWGTEPGDMTKGENVYHGGLLRFDMTPKPAFYEVDKMFNQEWRTNLQLETDYEGKAAFRGFYGDYELTFINENGESQKEITITKNSENAYKLVI